MNLYSLLQKRAADGNPLRIGLIGAGKFGSMYLSQVRRTVGMHLVGVADLSPVRAKSALKNVGWSAAQMSARSFSDAAKKGSTFITDDSAKMIASAEIDIIIDATGNPAVGIQNVLRCCEWGKHIIMVNVEADALARAALGTAAPRVSKGLKRRRQSRPHGQVHFDRALA